MNPFSGVGAQRPSAGGEDADIWIPSGGTAADSVTMTPGMKSLLELWKMMETFLMNEFEKYAYDDENDDKWAALFKDAIEHAKPVITTAGTSAYYFSTDDVKFLLVRVIAPWLTKQFAPFVIEVCAARSASSKDRPPEVLQAFITRVEELSEILAKDFMPSFSYYTTVGLASVSHDLEKLFWPWLRMVVPFVRFVFRENRDLRAALNPPPAPEQDASVGKFLAMLPSENEFRCVVPKAWVDEWRRKIRSATQSLVVSGGSGAAPAQEPAGGSDVPADGERAPDAQAPAAETPAQSLPEGPDMAPVDSLLYYDYKPELGEFRFRNHTYDYNDEKVEAIRTEAFNLLCLWYGGGPRMMHRMIKKRKYSSDPEQILPLLSKFKVTFWFEALPVAGVTYTSAGSSSGRETAVVYTWPTVVLKELLEAAVKTISDAELRARWQSLIETTDAVEVYKGSSHYGDDEPLSLSTNLVSIVTDDYVAFSVSKAAVAGETKYVPGHCGLTNLGNTCFMNSALQCISTSHEFREAFCKLDNLDPANHPVTIALQDLLKKLWSGRYSCVRPTALKEAFGAKCRRFQGYEQQDSIEYVQALLDVVHEELNPIKKKNYRERQDSDMAIAEAELARIYWEDHLANNKSIIAEFFHGQMKSRLECLTCGRVSIVFDGISCFPVNIDKHDLWSYDVRVCFPEHTPRPDDVMVRVRIPVGSPMTMLIAELRQWLQEHGHDPLQLLVAKDGPAKPNDYIPDELFRQTTKNDRYIAYVLPSYVAVHREKEALAKKKEEAERIAREKAEEKRKREKELGANKKAKVEGASTEDAASLGPLASSTVAVDSTSAPSQPTEGAAAEPVEVEKPLPVLNRILVCIEPLSTWDTYYFDDLKGEKVPIHVRKNLSASQIIDAVEATALRYLRRIGAEPAEGVAASGTEDSAAAVAAATTGATTSSPGKTTKLPTRSSPGGISDDDTDLASSDAAAAAAPLKTRLFRFRERLHYQKYDINEKKAGQWFGEHADYAIIVAHYDTDKYEPIPVKVVNDETMTTVPVNKVSKTLVSLEKCLSVKTVLLNGTDQWYCPSCKEHRDAKKDERVYRLPRVCIVQFKRFQMCPSTFTMRKLDTDVTFPGRLDFTPYVADSGMHFSTKFELRGVVHHSGSLAFGHYTASGKCPDEKWIDYNDSWVSPMTGELPAHGHAYLLFYSALDNATVIEPRVIEGDDDEVVVAGAADGARPPAAAAAAAAGASGVNRPIADMNSLD